MVTLAPEFVASRFLTTCAVLLASVEGASGQKQMWVAQFGTTEVELALTISADGSGGAFVAGYIERFTVGPQPSIEHAWVAKYGESGTLEWYQPFGSRQTDMPIGSAPDGSGGAYLCGFTNGALAGPPLGNSDAWLARFDAVGNPLWMKQFGTAGWDGANAACLDVTGGLCLAGYTSGSMGQQQFGMVDAWIAKFDDNGLPLWIRQLGTSNEDVATAIASNAAGVVYAAGDTYGSFSGTIPPNLDAWVACFDRNGVQQWVQQLGVLGDQDRATGLALVSRPTISLDTALVEGEVQHGGDRGKHQTWIEAPGARLAGASP